MSTALALTVHNGKFETAEDLGTIGLKEGAETILVSAHDKEIVFLRERSMYMGMTVDE